MNSLQPFHLAIPVNDLQKTRSFYRDFLGCSEGRSSEHWVDMNFFGHQLVLHLNPEQRANKISNPVDGHDVTVPHFGVVLEWQQWNALAQKLQDIDFEFVINPYIRFKGQIGEQATMFFLDPSGNALEFKAFKQMDQLFAH